VGDALFRPVFLAYDAAHAARRLAERHEWLVPALLLAVAVLA
jgi:hypothetical protein